MNDTIAAIASGIGNAAIGIIRVSGPETFSKVGSLFRNKRGESVDLSALLSHTAHYGSLVSRGQILDEVLLVLYKGPHSYTGEDSIEIDCHGGVFVMRKILNALTLAGVRAALPGEFSKRAFLNGRMDLSQAEAVMNVVQAENSMILTNSLKQLQGSLGQKVKAIRSDILYRTAYIEAALDDPEHYDVSGYGTELDKDVTSLIERIDALLVGSNLGRYMKDGICTVILGKPNVGKSSLLNCLLGTERAIVTELPGTTRDTLEESVELDGLPLRLIDTAGLRKTKEKVEQIGIVRAMEKAREADLVIGVIDASMPLDDNDKEMISFLYKRKSILLLNKTDLSTITSREDVRSLLSLETPIIETSTKNAEGMSALKDTIRKMFFGEKSSLSSGSLTGDAEVVTNLRHKEALSEAKASLLQVRTSIAENLPEDFYTIDLMAAADALGEITGETARDELIDTIFHNFCMGK